MGKYRSIDKAIRMLDEHSYNIEVKRKSDGRTSVFKSEAASYEEAKKRAIKQAKEEFGGAESDFEVV